MPPRRRPGILTLLDERVAARRTGGEGSTSDRISLAREAAVVIDVERKVSKSTRMPPGKTPPQAQGEEDANASRTGEDDVGTSAYDAPSGAAGITNLPADRGEGAAEGFAVAG